jgi:hypothetical protein
VSMQLWGLGFAVLRPGVASEGSRLLSREELVRLFEFRVVHEEAEH